MTDDPKEARAILAVDPASADSDKTVASVWEGDRLIWIGPADEMPSDLVPAYPGVATWQEEH